MDDMLNVRDVDSRAKSNSRDEDPKLCVHPRESFRDLLLRPLPDAAVVGLYQSVVDVDVAIIQILPQLAYNELVDVTHFCDVPEDEHKRLSHSLM